MTQPQLLVLRTPQDIKDLQDYLKDKEIIAYDSETTGLSKSDEIIGFSVCAEEGKAYYVVLSYWNVETKQLEYYPENKLASIELIKSLQGKSLIMHNAIFDCMMAEAFFKVSLIESLHTDTTVLAHLLDENRRIGLKELGASIFGEESTEEAKLMKESVAKNGGSLTKTNYEIYKADSELMGKYGAKDTILTYKLFYHLVPELYEQGLEDFFYKDESMPLLKGSTYQLNTIGLKVDLNTMNSLKKTLEAECAEHKSFIYQEIAEYIKEKYPATNKKNGFNIGASQQLSWLLFGELDLEFNTLTKEGKTVAKYLAGRIPYTKGAKNDFIKACIEQKGSVYEPEGFKKGKVTKAKKLKDPWAYIACDKKTLKKYSARFKWIEVLLEYQRKMKLLTTYVEGISERAKYGIINPSFKQAGTTSGRYSSSNPNFQNLPRDDKRIKACIVARPGKVFVGADQSQLEPRMFAYSSGDKRLIEAFNSDSDFYSTIGMGVYGKTDCTPHKEGSPEAFGVKYKKLRDLSKVIGLASTYGATARQLAPTTGKSVEDTQADIDTYFNRFPDVAKMMANSHKTAIKQGYVSNMFGRRRRIPEAMKIPKIYGTDVHAELPYEARNLLNLAVNHPIQSGGASIVNRGAIRFNEMIKEAGIEECYLVLQVHDQLVAECLEKDAENVAILMQEAMENTVVLPGVPFEAIPKIGKTLADV